MPLTEEQAAKIILVRSIEEVEPGFFSPKVLTDALAAAGAVGPGLVWVETRAAYLFERISAPYQSILELTKLPTPWTLPVCVLGLILGAATNLLGPAEKIHVVRNPVLLLVAWNILVYLVGFSLLLLRSKNLGFARLMKRSRNFDPRIRERKIAQGKPNQETKVPWLVRLILPGLWQFFHKMVFGIQEKRTFAEVVRRFSTNWISFAASLVAARSKHVLHMGALFMATGAIGGMYFRGLFQGYEVVWASTFVTDASSVSTFVDILFGPSLFLSQLLGLRLAEQISVTRLLTPQGDEAAAWIHLFAITVVIGVVIPRILLAAWQWRAIKIASSGLTFSFDEYYAGVIDAPIRRFVEKEVEASGAKFSEDVAAFVSRRLYDEQIVPRLRSFRQEGGRVADLKFELISITEGFLPQLTAFIVETGVPEFRTSLSGRIGEMLRGIGTDFSDLDGPREVVGELKIPAAEIAAASVGGQLTAAATASVGTSVAVVLGTIGGGIGEELGIAIIASVLGTTGPVGFLIGLLIGVLAAAGVWWYSGQKISEAVESINLPAMVVRTTLWETRFERLVEGGRKKCEDSVRAKIDEKLQALIPKVTEEILLRVRGLWAS
ncbi:MAG: hypothetical protein ACREQ7_21155 [Candidatus Binatia bacterium]